MTIIVSEVSFVKFGRAISRAGMTPGEDPMVPLLLLAFFPPGLRDATNSKAMPDQRLWGVAQRFNDRGDDSIEEINELLGSHWF